jgi:hypothetical protein
MWGRTWRTETGARRGNGCGWLLLPVLLQHRSKPHHSCPQRKFLDAAQFADQGNFGFVFGGQLQVHREASPLSF